MNYLAYCHVDETTKKIDFMEFILNDDMFISYEAHPDVIDITEKYSAFIGADVDVFADNFYETVGSKSLYYINDTLYEFDLSDLDQQAQYNALINA